MRSKSAAIKIFLTFVIFSYVYFASKIAFANVRTITSSNDFSSGLFNNTEAETRQGELKLKPDGAWQSLSWPAPPLGLGNQAGVVSDGHFVYVLFSGDNYFARYVPEENTWEELASAPHFALQGTSLVKLGDYIYAIFGGYQKSFARYSISQNTWENLADLPDFVWDGASLETDGTYIYALRGSWRTEFWRYDPSANKWESKASAPVGMCRGADMVYYQGNIYAFRGCGWKKIYRYNIADNKWYTTTVSGQPLADAPLGWYWNNNITLRGNEIFVARGQWTQDFYKYNIDTNTWTTLANTPERNGWVGVVYNAYEDYIYVFQGNGRYDWWKYDPNAGVFIDGVKLPYPARNGSHLIYDGSNYIYYVAGRWNRKFYRLNLTTKTWETLADLPDRLGHDTKGVIVSGALYLLRAWNSQEFWKYDIASNTWSTLASPPFNMCNGAQLVYPGSGDYIYATRGCNSRSFLRYSISGNVWDDTSVADLPDNADADVGARLAWDGTNIYYIGGYNRPVLLKYDIASNTWTEVSTLPFTPHWGTDMAYYNGKLYFLEGLYKTGFWEYDIAGGSWKRLPSLPVDYGTKQGVFSGGSLVVDNTGKFYASLGNDRYWIRTFVLSNYRYPASGTWESDALDLGYVSAWSSFTYTASAPAGTSITVETKTSSDKKTWSSWQQVTGNTISSPVARYIKVRITLTSDTTRTKTPVFYGFSINYTGDTNPPSPPSSFTGLSQQVGGVTLISGQKYGYQHPYFTWSGASDSEGSIEGYYVYFGTDSQADPQTQGMFITQNSLLVNTPMSNGTYYLRIKAKDSAGNVSSAVTGFTYIYEDVSPPKSLVASSSAQFNSGTLTSVEVKSDSLKLASQSAGVWLQESVSMLPFWISYGSDMTYYQAGNKLYVLRGGNTVHFLEYDISTDTWTQKADLPDPVHWGGAIVAGPSGYLYALRGRGTSSFYRYDIANDQWSDADAADPSLTFYYGAALIYDGSRYIYALRGYGDDAFLRYDTQTDTWEELANVDFGAPDNQINNYVSTGGDLAFDGNSTIYAIQGGGRTGFAAYDITSDSWRVLPNLPAIAGRGARIAYDSSTESIYFMPGVRTPYLYRFDIGTQTWERLPDAPLWIEYGDMEAVNGKLYVLRGWRNFYVYNIKKRSWMVPTRGLFGRVFRGSSLYGFGYGANIIKGDNNYFYLTRGGADTAFIKYHPATGEVTKLAPAPAGFHYGGALVYVSTENKIYAVTSWAYRKFFVYDIASDTWSEVTTDPPPRDPNNGSTLVFDGSRYIYWIAGQSGYFYRYDLQGQPGSRWQQLANAVYACHGADMVYRNGKIYYLRGCNSNKFYVYDPATNTWDDASVADLPSGARVYYGGFLVDTGGDYLYSCLGGNKRECYRYSFSQNSWEKVADSPAYIHAGGDGDTLGDGKIYVIAGPGTNTFSDGLYVYVYPTNTTAVAESGEYVSQVYDFEKVYKWANLEVEAQLLNNTSITVYTRSSSDNSTWEGWSQASYLGYKGNTRYYRVLSTPNRYFQVKIALSSGDGVYSPQVSSYTIYYYQDKLPPTNPTSLTAYPSATSSATLSSGNWYNYSQPKFDWPDEDETGGATDTATGSGVLGYYVYFGTDSQADPETQGTFVTSSEYTASNLTSGQTYYLRIKTKDKAGNVSQDVWQPFVYKFDNEPPSNPTTIVVDPPGYTRTNSFNFSWSGATDSASLVDEYCYKTGDPNFTETCTKEASVSAILAYKTGVNTFYLRVKDKAGNYSTDYVTTSYYYSSTAPSPPTNLRITYPVGTNKNTVNEFAFAWDPPDLYYGKQSGLRYYYSVNAEPTADNVNSVGLVDTYLPVSSYATQKGRNVLYVVAKDEAGNIDYNNYASIEFYAETSAPGTPRNLDISDVSIKETKSWRLALSWDAPVATGSGVALYKIYRVDDGPADCRTDFSKFSMVATTTQTSYVDTNLTQTTKYYCVAACDSTNQCSAPSDTVSLFPDGRWRVPPTLVASPSATVKTRTAIIRWTTNRTANSFVKFGTKSGEYGNEVGSSTHVTDHEITLTNLEPDTTYYYIAMWTDEDGNTGVSEELTFKTNPAPSVSSVKFSSININSALVTFVIKNAVKATIQYGKTTNYGGSISLATAKEESTYTVQLTDLEEGTLYHLRIVAEDEEGNLYNSDDYTFETLPIPKISKVRVQQVVGMPTATLRILWETNTLASSIVTFYPTANPERAVDRVDLALKTKHEMIIKGLQDETEYTLIIKGKDSMNNEAEPQKVTVKTISDIRAPQIINMNVESTIIGVGDEATAQVVVTWDTDEPATTQVEYGEGTGTSYNRTTQEDSSLTSNHRVTITGLLPGRIYHLRAVSKDKAGNVGYSYDTVIVTPKASKGALDIVIDNLSDTFVFLKDLFK